jgi:predicted nucleic-acid-binding Zn-ribbon protein
VDAVLKRRKTELERTCKRCGTVRYVSHDVAKVKQAKAAGWATPVVGRKRQELKAHQALVEQQRHAADTCPQCGSSAYDEREVPIT